MLENNNLSYIAQNHSSVTISKPFVYRRQMNITTELAEIIEYHNISIETPLTVCMIIQA